jgi:hypothetical protein
MKNIKQNTHSHNGVPKEPLDTCDSEIRALREKVRELHERLGELTATNLELLNQNQVLADQLEAMSLDRGGWMEARAQADELLGALRSAVASLLVESVEMGADEAALTWYDLGERVSAAIEYDDSGMLSVSRPDTPPETFESFDTSDDPKPVTVVRGCLECFSPRDILQCRGCRVMVCPDHRISPESLCFSCADEKERIAAAEREAVANAGDVALCQFPEDAERGGEVLNG